ncbi:MAG: hypothetical protein AAF357_08280 [Verrucomicrobiota bacterium]
MNPDSPDPFDEWLHARREQPAPTPSSDFSQRIMRVLESSPSTSSILLAIAAMIAVALIGFLRMELLTHLLFSSPTY